MGKKSDIFYEKYGMGCRTIDIEGRDHIRRKRQTSFPKKFFLLIKNHKKNHFSAEKFVYIQKKL